MIEHVIELPTPQTVEALGRILAPWMEPGAFLGLTGTLGAGKSTLARALIRAAMNDPELDVPSPTFTLVQTYETPEGMSLWHLDLYRIEKPAEVLELGWEEGLATAAMIVEWPENARQFQPRDRLEVHLLFAGTGRRAVIHAYGNWRARLADFSFDL